MYKINLKFFFFKYTTSNSKPFLTTTQFFFFNLQLILICRHTKQNKTLFLCYFFFSQSIREHFFILFLFFWKLYSSMENLYVGCKDVPFSIRYQVTLLYRHNYQMTIYCGFNISNYAVNTFLLLFLLFVCLFVVNIMALQNVIFSSYFLCLSLLNFLFCVVCCRQKS